MLCFDLYPHAHKTTSFVSANLQTIFVFAVVGFTRVKYFNFFYPPNVLL